MRVQIHNLTLKTQFIILSALMIAGFAAVGLTVSVGKGNLEKIQGKAFAAVEINDHAAPLESAFLTARRAEKDFLLRLDEKYVTRHDEIQALVAAAVEEQSAATQQISRNVQEVSTATNEVNKNINGVSDAASRTGDAANTVSRVSLDMAQETLKLKETVDSFLMAVKNA